MSFLFSRVWSSSSKDDHDDDHTGAPSSSAYHAPNHLYWSNSSTLHLNTAMVSAPIQKPSPVSLTGFDDHWQQRKNQPSTVAWLSTTDDNGEQIVTSLPIVPPPAVQKSRLGGTHIHPISRTVSSPATSPSYSSPSYSSPSPSPSTSSPSPSSGTKLVPPRLQMNRASTRSTQSLRLDSTTHDRYGKKQLSPIAEQDYFSPESLRRSIPLPSISAELTPVSPTTNHSHNTSGSDITRPSPVYSSPFILRPLNRTGSQSSSRTHISTTQSETPPSIPPLDLRPPFPGPHPSHDGDGPALRPRKSLNFIHMPTIGSEEEGPSGSEYGGESDIASLHADSFVTASDSLHERSSSSYDAGPVPFADRDSKPDEFPSLTTVDSADPPRSPPSASESFIARRWDRFASLYAGPITFETKPSRLSLSPACWAFWLGFLCPFLWLVGGWHFTNFGEQPPRLTFCDFYFNIGYWKVVYFCHGRRREKKGKECVLPRWVEEKSEQSNEVARMNDARRSRRGFLFGYPFVPRPTVPSGRRQGSFRCCWDMGVKTFSKPNWFLDHFYGIRLSEVKGRKETGRRMIDPWIQRCRYAFCYLVVLFFAGLLAGAIYLLVINTKGLR
ncbi:uncharacterized protein EV420DRAFT_226821 [Desarmillaria tabescens]|uniref:Uncharacterized protein n=1 Tax=Armillaria tabescens TaxID=1929756 RepID=A0AA39TJ26_ARMTA|nr:uncharacterized protein EV420DRAFT_226821 [Desarmillaria tabescens]KAK0460707.1 hypothetical protein EV420DRAFT_226821 [Desarmillaria tabescens]